LQEGIWKQVALPDLDAELRDQRLTRNLDPAKPFAEKKQIDILQKSQTLTLPDILSSDLETYDTIGSVFSLLLTLCDDSRLPTFAWILEWPKLSDADKRAKYSEFSCHELNVFLSRKDPEFFAKVVAPYLRNKKDKTFIDEYLLGTDLRRYLEPWRFAQLNAAERAFLISRLQAEGTDIARHLRELWELLPPAPEEADRLFEIALRGRSLDEAAGLAFDAAKSEIQAAAAPAPAMPERGAAPPRPAAAPADRTRGGASLAGRVVRAEEAEAALGKAQKLNEELGVLADSAPREFKRRSGKDDVKLALGEVESLHAFMDVDGVAAARAQAIAQAYFRKLGPTKEWAENNYYHLPIQQQNAELITINAFWRDLAAYLAGGGKGSFVSPHVAEAHKNLAEVMLALAFTDLPFEAPKHETKVDGGAYTLTLAAPFLPSIKRSNRPLPRRSNRNCSSHRTSTGLVIAIAMKATRSSTSTSPTNSSPAPSTGRMS
jgi:hypothetical protein